MTIESFFTPNNTATGQGKNLPGTGGSKSSVLGGAINGIDFFNMLFALNKKANAAGNAAITQNSQQGEKPLQSGNPLLDQDPKLDITTTISAHPDIEKQAEHSLFDEQTTLSNVLSLNQKAFDDLMKPVINKANKENLIIEKPDGQAGAGQESAAKHAFILDAKNLEKLSDIVKSLEKIIQQEGTLTQPQIQTIEQIQSKLKNIETDGSLVIAANFTPLQLTDLKRRISDLLNQAESLSAKIAQAPDTGLPALNDNQSAARNKANNIAGGNAPDNRAANSALPAQNNSGQPNNLAAPNDNTIMPGFEFSEPAEGQRNINGQATDNVSAALTGKAQNADTGSNTATNTATNPAQPNTPGLATGLQADAFSGLTAGLENVDQLFEEIRNSLSGLSVTSAHSAANALTSAPSAHASNPASQMVAATLHKNAGNGVDRNITLQLDPPELGRVEVRMNFSKDKSMKAQIVVEKPETFLMLQRDSHMLERALQEAGLDADGSLNFEMAEEGYDFNDQSGGRGNNGHASGGQNENGTDEIIETTMTWHVDPETGHMRYDLLV